MQVDAFEQYLSDFDKCITIDGHNTSRLDESAAMPVEETKQLVNVSA